MSSLSRMPGYIYIYFLCQSINLTAAVISVTVAATVGSIVAPKESLATLPYGIQFLSILIATYPVSILMEKKGRKLGFILGAISLMISGVIGYIAITENSFVLLIASHALLGVFTACANYYRFAAVDNISGKLKSRVLSLVIAGGLLAGVFGPAISNILREVEGFQLFSLCYGFLTILAVINIILICFLPKDNRIIASSKIGKKTLNAKESDMNIYPVLCFAIISSAIGYGLMNLIMIQSSLQMHNMHLMFKQSAYAIQWHVVAMFAPSFISGFLLNKFGHEKVIGAGFCLFILAFITNMYESSYILVLISLITLGVAWNFTYVGGSAYIAVLLEESANAKRWQGVSDTVVAIMAMAGAMFPSVLMSSIGWQGSNMLSIILITCCMLFLLILSSKTVAKGCRT